MSQARVGLGERLARQAAAWTGSNTALALALATVIVWIVTGPIFHFSDAWQLVINSLTNVATFVMVFLIQRSQNKDSLAIQLKLDEIVAALHGASNQLISVEDLSEDDLRRLHARFAELSKKATGSGPTSVERAAEEPERRD